MTIARFGAHIAAIYDQVTRYQGYLLVALGVFVIALIVRHVVRRHRRRETINTLSRV